MSDILIIGSGVIGLSCAWHLAKAGATVTILEKHRPGAGASGAALGTLINPKATRKGWLTQWKRESLQKYPNLIEELKNYSDIETGYRKSGHIEVVCTDRKRDDLNRATQANGATIHLISPQEAKEIVPEIEFGSQMMAFDPETISLSPAKLTAAWRAACEGVGVKILSGIHIEKLIVENGSVKGVIDAENRGYFAAKTLVCAALGSESLLKQVDFTYPMTAIRGQAFTLKFPEIKLNPIIDYQLENQSWIGETLMINQWPNDYLAVGATVEKKQGLRAMPEKDAIDAMFADLCRILPAAKNGKIDYMWAGMRPRGATSKPFIDKVPETENLYAAIGHAKIGFYLAPITGEKIAQIMLQNSPNSVC